MRRPRPYVSMDRTGEEQHLPDAQGAGLLLSAMPEQSSELDNLRGRCTLEQIHRFLYVPA